MKIKIPESRIDDEPELSTAQLARHFNFNVATINNWRAAGMPAIKYNSRLFRYKLSKVEDWLRTRGKKSAA